MRLPRVAVWVAPLSQKLPKRGLIGVARILR
jgi:hypothetical protein